MENSKPVLPKRIPAIKSAGAFALLSTAEYVLFHLFYLFLTSYTGYYIYFVQRTTLCLLFVAAAATVYSTAKTVKQLISHSFLISATRAIFFFPFFYILALSNPLWHTVEALLFSFLTTVIAVVIHANLVAIVAFIIKKACAKRGMAENEITSPKDFKSPFTSTVLIISFVVAMINLAEALLTALINVVNANIIYIKEIIYAVITLLFPIAMLAGMYFLSILIAHWVRKMILKAHENLLRKAEATALESNTTAGENTEISNN